MTLIVDRSAETLREATTVDLPRYPGTPAAMDGTAAVVAMETAASEAAGVYPITPSTQMGEGWAQAVAEGRTNVNGRRLLFFEPEGEHAAAAVTAGMAMVGLRSTNFSSGQGIVYMHESLYPAVGKRLTYVLNMACRAITKHALNVHAGHDDYHAIDDTGFFQLFAKDAQAAADLNLIAHRIAELALNPGVCAQDGFLTSHVIESLRLPERELVREYLGDPADWIESPTAAQRLLFGDRRRRIPELFDWDLPKMIGVVQNQDSYAQGVAAQRPFFFDHVAPLADRAMAEYAALTGRRYRRAMGYRSEDAELLLVGQGSVVANAEAVADWLRERRGLRVGVLDMTMFRPFPADLVVELLAGKRAAVVLERVDQPLAVDPPLLRELRAACGKAMENARAAHGPQPHANIPACLPWAIPDFYSACFGLGSRDLQPGDLIAAVENALAGNHGRRQVYLGIDFVRREGAGERRLAGWQQQIASGYPDLADLALPRAENPSLLPADALALRIHSIGGWGAITMGKNLTMTLFDLLGVHVKSNPKYGSEKKGQPTTFHAVFAGAPVRTNGELAHVDVVMSPDGGVFRHSDPLRGLARGGALVLQSAAKPEAAWASLPSAARRVIREREIRLWLLDGLAIARGEAASPALRFRMQGAAFQGAFFRVTPLVAQAGFDEAALFDAIRAQLARKFGKRDPQLVEENLRVVRRGFAEVREVHWQELEEEALEADLAAPVAAPAVVAADALGALADADRFACQVCAGYHAGEEPIADPLLALSAIPAATGALRDLSGIRLEVPVFLAERCTGCGHCWTHCPDAAIPGLVVEVPALLRAAAAEERVSPVLRALLPQIADVCTRLVHEPALPESFAAIWSTACATIGGALELSSGERAAFGAEVERVATRLAELPVARTAPFFTVAEKKQPGSGGLLAVTVNPNACKGCNECIEVCEAGALVPVPQTDERLAQMRRAWSLWERLPDTPARFVKVSDLDGGKGVLHSLLLQKSVFRSMTGGDGACMGCGEKTAVHLVVAAAEAAARPRALHFVEKLDHLIAGLDAEIDRLARTAAATAAPIQPRLARLRGLERTLRDLRWRYTDGPTGRGRAALGIANSTGCSSVWASTYPYNPYPYPWTNHLFQDAPSIGIGLFEGLMRKMADAFAAVRRAELELDGAYDAETHEPFFAAFDWQAFSDEEYRLCPPMLVIGGDGAMLDIGFQNLSRLLASGKPLKVVVLDTQVYSNTGGQACTSGFLGQVSDMAAWGAARHGKLEQRKELALLTIAHRGAFLVQSSQASPGHLMGGVLRALVSRRPAVINLYTPCQGEHAIADSASARAARLALESRAFPFVCYDPDAGETLAECISLDGNPAPRELWPRYKLTGKDEQGNDRALELPLTTADWAATEPRFERHFRELRADEEGVARPFHEVVTMAPQERTGVVPYLWTRGRDGALGKLAVSTEMVALAEDRLALWRLLREMAGAEVPAKTRATIEKPLRDAHAKELAALRARYETELASARGATVAVAAQ